ADRRGVLPVAGGPAGQAGVRRACEVADAGRTAGRAARTRSDAAPADQGRGAGGRAGDRAQPTRRLGQVACGGTNRGGMTLTSPSPRPSTAGRTRPSVRGVTTTEPVTAPPVTDAPPAVAPPVTE